MPWMWWSALGLSSFLLSRMIRISLLRTAVRRYVMYVIFLCFAWVIFVVGSCALGVVMCLGGSHMSCMFVVFELDVVRLGGSGSGMPWG